MSVPFQHKEAFCLMKYQTKDGSETEWIWNSRDGVTPFGLMSRSGKEMFHVEWHKDRCVPGFTPTKGTRIFVDMTPEIAREAAARKVEAWWDHPQYPMSQGYSDKEAAIQMLVDSYLEQPGAPAIQEVG